jgi:hypothetical protein
VYKKIDMTACPTRKSGKASNLFEVLDLLYGAEVGLMMVIEIVGDTLPWTCEVFYISYTSCSVLTIPLGISVTLRGVLGTGGKRPILNANAARYRDRRHIRNQGTLVLENLELTNGFIRYVRSRVCVSVAVGSA